MNMNKYLDIAPEVQRALADGRPVVALESTIISHGMPYPKNVETALLVEQTLRDNGAVPATIAILGGRLKAGLSKEEITYSLDRPAFRRPPRMAMVAGTAPLSRRVCSTSRAVSTFFG